MVVAASEATGHWADSNAIRVLGYVTVGALMLLAYRNERRRAGELDEVWPGFWALTGVFVLAMAAARAVEAGDLVSSLGRDAAGSWYESRRPIQAAVVGVVGVIWFVIVAVSLWRTPERRRRYLPVGLLVVTLAGFAAVRVISLHQIDSILYRTHIGGVRVSTFVELTLLLLTGLATAPFLSERVGGLGFAPDERASQANRPG